MRRRRVETVETVEIAETGFDRTRLRRTASGWLRARAQTKRTR